MTSLPHIALEYSPYHTLPAFSEGYLAYAAGNYSNPYDNGPGYKAQAWDRGLECGARERRWLSQYVGQN